MTDVHSDLEGAATRNGSAAQAAAESEVTRTTELSSGSLGAVPDKPRRRVTWRLGRRWLVPAMWVVVPVALFFCYLRVSQTEPGDSYGAVFTQIGRASGRERG